MNKYLKAFVVGLGTSFFLTTIGMYVLFLIFPYPIAQSISMLFIPLNLIIDLNILGKIAHIELRIIITFLMNGLSWGCIFCLMKYLSTLVKMQDKREK